MTRRLPSRAQRGSFALGLVAGLLLGLALALAVALYVTKAPVPFVNKVPQRTAEQDNAEAERNRHWDPNGALAVRPPPRPLTAPPAPEGTTAGLPPGIAPAASAPAPGARDPAAILAGGEVPPARSTATAPEAFIYFVQAGAYTRADDAEQQRARLALMGLESRIIEREQAGRTVYRVRIGPYPTRDAADGLQARLQESSVDTQIVRVERP